MKRIHILEWFRPPLKSSLASYLKPRRLPEWIYFFWGTRYSDELNVHIVASLIAYVTSIYCLQLVGSRNLLGVAQEKQYPLSGVLWYINYHMHISVSSMPGLYYYILNMYVFYISQEDQKPLFADVSFWFLRYSLRELWCTQTHLSLNMSLYSIISPPHFSGTSCQQIRVKCTRNQTQVLIRSRLNPHPTN